MKGWPGEPDMDYDVLVADGEAAANAGKPASETAATISAPTALVQAISPCDQ